MTYLQGLLLVSLFYLGTKINNDILLTIVVIIMIGIGTWKTSAIG